MRRFPVRMVALAASALCWASALEVDARGAAHSAVGFQPDPLAIAVDAAGSVYVVNPTARGYVQRFSADGTLVDSWGSSGQGPGELSGTNGIAAGPNGDLYVADSGNDRIQELTADGSFVRQWPSSNPRDVATDAAGNVYAVGDTHVQKFSAEGTPLGEWGTTGSGDGQLGEPWGIAVGPAGSVYVADTYSNRIEQFAADGSFVAQWGSYGSGTGQFVFPYGIATDTAGSVYVADTVNDRVQKFAASGTFLSAWGSAGRRPGQFHTPLAIATDMAGYVYVADEGAPYPFGGSSARIQKFTSLGKFVTQWRSPPLPPRPARPRISTKLAGETTRRTAIFHFGSPRSGTRFQCRLNGEGVPARLSRTWRRCVSPQRYRGLLPGRKVFRVRAVGNGGIGRPARRSWRIVTRG